MRRQGKVRETRRLRKGGNIALAIGNYALVTLLLCSQISGCAAARHRLGFALVPVETEIALGARIAASIEAREKILPLPGVQAYVRQIGMRLVRPSLQDRSGIRYRFIVLDDARQVNAFAVPGGHIYVYSGLLLAAGDEAEVAGVLAHEIGHVVGRHGANQLAAQLGMSILTRLALGEDPAQLASIALDWGSAGALRRFSREDEHQADGYGVAYAIAAGYDPRGLLTFFERLQKTERGERSPWENLMATHPPTSERIRRIEEMIARAGNPRGQTYRERFARETAALRGDSQVFFQPRGVPRQRSR